MAADVKAIAEELIKVIGQELGTIDAKSVTKLGDAVHLMANVAIKVEEHTSQVESLTSAEKYDVASHVLNYYVDIPWVPESLEDDVIRGGLHAFVGVFNKYLGKTWIGKFLGAETSANKGGTQ